MENNTGVCRTEQVLSPWVTLVTRNVRFSNAPEVHKFHSFKQADYVAMFAVTTNGKIPLVRQYRPALERSIWELPSGLLEPPEKPGQTASRELFEETGLRAGPKVEGLGCLVPDSGRLENHLWAFFTAEVNPQTAPDWRPEPRLENRLVSKSELKKLILAGKFEHALHLAAIGLAIIQGHFSF